MKNTFGNSVSLTLFGESHGDAVGCVLDGISPGVDVDCGFIEKILTERRPASELDTSRKEKDNFKILSGVFNGKTTGTPICIVIENGDKRSSDYDYGKARPSHADYAAYCKYHGFEDYRGGGHFSGRVTAALVAAGGILIPMLEKCGITVGTHILKCREIFDREFSNVEEDIALLCKRDFPVLDVDIGERMKDEILKARSEGDSVGGITQSAVCGIPAGVGEPCFDSVEGVVSHALFAVGAIKGIEFGKGFGFSCDRGSTCNDEFGISNGKTVTKTNNNGGINGGITNGMPIVFNCAVKPTPSIGKTQKTVDFIKKEECEISIRGRHDPAIIRRICPVVNSVTALAVCDLLASRFGTDFPIKGVEA